MNETKIQFCSGGNILQGWKNWDWDCDITERLPYPNNYADEILCEHGIEHVTGPQALLFLDECRRILKPQGKMWISIPVLDHLPFEHARDIVLGHGHLVPYMHGTVEAMIRLAGFSTWSQAEPAPDIFGHWKVIGRDKDNLESSRWLAIK